MNININISHNTVNSTSSANCIDILINTGTSDTNVKLQNISINDNNIYR